MSHFDIQKTLLFLTWKPETKTTKLFHNQGNKIMDPNHEQLVKLHIHAFSRSRTLNLDWTV